MATSWKSQQGNGKYALQFETDDKEKYKFVEKASQMAVDGKHTADVVEVVRCPQCRFGMKVWRERPPHEAYKCRLLCRHAPLFQPTHFCHCAEKKEQE